jgi:hypothetical protein
MPAEPTGTAVQTYRHADRLIFSKNVKSCPIDLDVEIDLLLRPEVAELFAQIPRSSPFIERPDCPPFRGPALGKEIIDVDLCKIEDNLDCLLFIGKLVPFNTLTPFCKLI